jgi:hypothetical protein
MGGVVPASDLGGYGRAWGGWWSEPPYSMHFGPDGGGMVTFLAYPPDDLVLVVKIQWLGGERRLGLLAPSAIGREQCAYRPEGGNVL